MQTHTFTVRMDPSDNEFYEKLRHMTLQEFVLFMETLTDEQYNIYLCRLRRLVIVKIPLPDYLKFPLTMEETKVLDMARSNVHKGTLIPTVSSGQLKEEEVYKISIIMIRGNIQYY